VKTKRVKKPKIKFTGMTRDEYHYWWKIGNGFPTKHRPEYHQPPKE
jgi:hypothetical protein